MGGVNCYVADHREREVLFETTLIAIEMKKAAIPYNAALARGVTTMDQSFSGRSHGGQVM